MLNSPSLQDRSSEAPPIPLAETSRQRFTIDGSSELENYLELACGRARHAVQAAVPSSILEGMLLGGGYGRSEGGVLRTAHGDRPYNDLEFYVFLKGPAVLTERKYQPLLHECAHRLSNEADLEIELRAASFRKVQNSQPNMFYYDLVMGHRWIVGDEHLLDGCDHQRQAERIPLSDAARLLLNRCSGLLFAKQRLLSKTFAAEDADFVGRNIAKAKLAMGDALLTMLGQYHWSCRERNQRMRMVQIDVPWLAQVKELHSEGVDFKLHPQQSSLTQTGLEQIHADISSIALRIWLWLESRRLQHEFRSVREYSFSSINKCPETNVWKNACINLSTFGPFALIQRPLRYPRERLLNSLPLLLWASASLEVSDPSMLQFLQHELRANARSFDSFVEIYRILWSRFN